MIAPRDERWYKGGMKATTKVKTSITISMPLLVQIDKLIGESASRSAYIEKVLSDHLRDEALNAIHQRDLELINANADYLNREAMDVLRYQAPIEWTTEDD
jgi:metal-responsive CopG/Arc/MetJ family transcriptional regulator